MALGGKGRALALTLVAACFSTEPCFADAGEPDQGRLTEPEESVESTPVPASVANKDHDGGTAQRGNGEAKPSLPAPGCSPKALGHGVSNQESDVATGDKPDQPKSHAEQDLEAQKEMASSTWGMLWVAIISLFLSALGLVLLVFTLFYTSAAAEAARDAVNEAQEATKAALASVDYAAASLEVTRDMGQRQLRAYVVVSGAKIEGPIKLDEHVHAVVTIKNTGQTPAYDLVAGSAVDIFDANDTIPTIPDTSAAGGSKAVLGPGCIKNLDPRSERSLSLEEKTNIISRESKLILLGRISYVDAFKEKRVTNFRFRLDNGVFKVEPDGNEAD